MELLDKVFESKNYGSFKIVKYTYYMNVDIEFISTKFQTKANMNNIKKGLVMDYLYPSVCGVGFIGVGQFEAKTNRDLYIRWAHMLERCGEYKNYKDVSVCTSWYNFQNFASWSIKQAGYSRNSQLDKDLLIKGNRVYSPDTCCYVPHRVNSLVIKSSGVKEDGLPCGVIWVARDGLYKASYRGLNSERFQYWTKSLEDAFSWYKQGKESVVKAVAEKFKNELDEKTYLALISWEVENYRE